MTALPLGVNGAHVIHVFCCFCDPIRDVVLVNRGWFPRSLVDKVNSQRGALKGVDDDSGTTTVTGVLRPPEQVHRAQYVCTRVCACVHVCASVCVCMSFSVCMCACVCT